jgi:hypothetical protein
MKRNIKQHYACTSRWLVAITRRPWKLQNKSVAYLHSRIYKSVEKETLGLKVWGLPYRTVHPGYSKKASDTES